MKYYYGNSYKEALGNDPVEIKTTKELREYEEVYEVVIPKDEVEIEEFWDIVWKRPGAGEQEQRSEEYDDYDQARADYVNMANGNAGELEYVILRKVQTDWDEYEDIEELDETDSVPGKEGK